MHAITPEGVVAAQIMYLKRLTCLKRRVTSVVKLSEQNSNLETAALETMEEIEKEVDDIQDCLRLLFHFSGGF